MLEKPDISDARLRKLLLVNYAVEAHGVAFLPIRNDQHSALYRAEGAPGRRRPGVAHHLRRGRDRAVLGVEEHRG